MIFTLYKLKGFAGIISIIEVCAIILPLHFYTSEVLAEHISATRNCKVVVALQFEVFTEEPLKV